MENTQRMPLEGIKVIELATVVAAPTAGRMLCAYGAEVIKVEVPGGEAGRRFAYYANGMKRAPAPMGCGSSLPKRPQPPSFASSAGMSLR